MPAAVQLIEDPVAVQALAAPVRLAVLNALREPDSAAGVGRAIGQPRQKANYHVRELERAGLVRNVGERRKGNFVEQLYQVSARRFIVSPRFTWDRDQLARALRDQVSLANLVDVGERLQRDATALLDRAATDGSEIASAAVTAEVSFADEAARAAFMEEYLNMLGPLLKKYGARDGEPFRVIMATYPDPEED